MSCPFDPQQGLIIVGAELWGPAGSAVLQLALDTGATSMVISVALLIAVGYDPALVSECVQITTGSGVEFAPRVTFDRIVTLRTRAHGLSGVGSYPAAQCRR
jgi:hypothetical protein